MMHRFLTFIFLFILAACQQGRPDAEKQAQQTSADSEKKVASVENAKEDLPEGMRQYASTVLIWMKLRLKAY